MTSGTEHIQSPRQRELIRAAERLFAERGYHAVGINDISAELGLTGPAFYRHYKSKEALLIAILDGAIGSHLETVRAIVAANDPPEATLRAIIDNHVEFVFDQSANITTWRTEFRNLPEHDRHRLRYLQRLYTEEWVRVVSLLRPEMGDERVRAMCQAAIALIQFPTEFATALPAEELGPMLSSLALGILTAPDNSSRRRGVSIPARRKADQG